jgi:glycosyltransferase involved in cell wall biosynthesis
VIHTTDAYFSYARTALRVSRRHGVPVVNSVHTDTPQYARIFTTQTMERLLGRGAAARFLVDRLGVPRFAERYMLRRLAAHQRACAAVLVSRPEQLAPAAALTGGRAGLLRRGVDLDFFSPAKRDRAWLASAYGIPPDRTVVLFAGRVNRSKNVMLVAEAVGTLAGRGQPVHLFCAGEGEQRNAILARLGSHATCPGNLAPEILARVYAAADVFAFPSPVEECANVVLEALASGLPVMVARESGMGRIVADGKTGFALAADRPFAWARFIDMLATDPARRAAMAQQARSYAERHLPSWRDVLAGDLMPHWQRAAMAPRALE